MSAASAAPAYGPYPDSLQHKRHARRRPSARAVLLRRLEELTGVGPSLRVATGEAHSFAEARLQRAGVTLKPKSPEMAAALLGALTSTNPLDIRLRHLNLGFAVGSYPDGQGPAKHPDEFTKRGRYGPDEVKLRLAGVVRGESAKQAFVPASILDYQEVNEEFHEMMARQELFQDFDYQDFIPFDGSKPFGLSVFSALPFDVAYRHEPDPRDPGRWRKIPELHFRPAKPGFYSYRPHSTWVHGLGEIPQPFLQAFDPVSGLHTLNPLGGSDHLSLDIVLEHHQPPPDLALAWDELNAFLQLLYPHLPKRHPLDSEKGPIHEAARELMALFMAQRLAAPMKGKLGGAVIGDVNTHATSSALVDNSRGLNATTTREEAVATDRPYSTSFDLREHFARPAQVATRVRELRDGWQEYVFSDQAIVSPELVAQPEQLDWSNFRPSGLALLG